MCSHQSICLSDDSISKILNEDHTEPLIREDVVQHIHVFCRERCNDHSEIIHRIPGTSRRGSMMIGIASRHISPFRKTASKREFATGSSPSSQACGSSGVLKVLQTAALVTKMQSLTPDTINRPSTRFRHTRTFVS